MLRREQFKDLVLEDALPVLEEIVTDSMEEFPMEHERIFNVRTMTTGIAQHTQTTGIPAVGQLAEGEEYPMDQMVQGYDKTYKAVKYGVIVPITEELLEDNQHEDAIDRAEALARAMREAERISAASVFNNAFSTTGPDGKSLCATDHPLPYPGAGTSSNRLATDADLSLASIEDMVTLMRGTKDGSGKKVLVRPRHLIVPPSLEFLAHELLQSDSKPQASTANNLTEVNAVNAVRARYGLEPIVMDYLTDDDAWFLAAGQGSHKLFWYWRKRPVTSSDMEFKSDVALIKIKARWDVGYSDFRGIAGTTGAG
jgi:phage major head subunit gpT-like protein